VVPTGALELTFPSSTLSTVASWRARLGGSGYRRLPRPQKVFKPIKVTVQGGPALLPPNIKGLARLAEVQGAFIDPATGHGDLTDVGGCVLRHFPGPRILRSGYSLGLRRLARAAEKRPPQPRSDQVRRARVLSRLANIANLAKGRLEINCAQVHSPPRSSSSHGRPRQEDPQSRALREEQSARRRHA
jgi:hypothetical protein